MLSRRSIRKHKIESYTGLLLPTSGRTLPLALFKLVTPSRTYLLEVPDSLSQYLRKHLWEQCVVKGELHNKHFITVKRAQIKEDESTEEMKNFEDESELALYEYQIHHGFTLEAHGYDVI